MERDDAWHMTDDLMVEDGKGDPFAAAIRATRMPMIVTDPRQDDNPIVFVNDAFLRSPATAAPRSWGATAASCRGRTPTRRVEQLREAMTPAVTSPSSS